MSNNQECAGYFKSQKAYRRCFAELKKKWKSYGKVAGQIVLKQASEEECRAIGGILGKHLEAGDIRFSFAEFEQGLQKTRFAPVDMKQVLEAYFGETLTTNQEKKQGEKERKKDFFRRQQEAFRKQWGEASSAVSWLLAMEEEQKYGYQLLIKEYTGEEKLAEQLLQTVGTALSVLESRGKGSAWERSDPEEELPENRSYPLAVFAAEIIGNPHYFDRGTTAGQLLVHALCFLEKREVPANAHEWREVLTFSGIVPDNVSSMVHVLGLRLRTAEGYHPAYEAFWQRQEPCVITMENLQGITGACAVEKRAYVVENEMVFSYLLERVRTKKVTLLCTSGQFRTAALTLLSFLAKDGTEIYYSGDLDPEGLVMADRLWKKFGACVHMWRMRPEDYQRGSSAERVEDARLSQLSHIQNPLLKETADCLRKTRLAAYQENLLEELLGDIR